jgi:hypothetical protein
VFITPRSDPSANPSSYLEIGSLKLSNHKTTHSGPLLDQRFSVPHIDLSKEVKMVATRDQLIQMHPKLRMIYPDFDNEMEKKGLNYGITCVARLRKEQIALYSQGRDLWSTVYVYRSMADMYVLDPKYYPDYDKIVKAMPGKNKYVVTWTLNSLHVIDLDDELEFNNFSRAFDIVMKDKYKKPTYDLKCDSDQDGIGDYLEAANISKSVGLTPGAFFKDRKGNPNPDYPHHQVDL